MQGRMQIAINGAGRSFKNRAKYVPQKNPKNITRITQGPLLCGGCAATVIWRNIVMGAYDDLVPVKDSTDPYADLLPKTGALKSQTAQGDLLSSSIIRGGANLLGFPGDVINMTPLGAMIEKSPAASMIKSIIWPSAKNITEGVERTTGVPLYRPESTSGRMAGAAIEGAVSAGPIGAVPALFNAAGNVAGETAGDMAPNSPWAKPVASVATSLGLSVPSMLRSSAGTILNDATRGIDEATYRKAHELINEATKRGIKITPAEALAQVQGSANTPLLNLQRVVEQSRGGAPAMSAAMGQRPGQVEAAANAELNKIGPATSDPFSLAPRVQRAATDTIVEAEKLRTSASTPFFNRANELGKIDRADAMRVIADIDAQIAKDTTGTLAKNLGPVKDLLTAQKATPTIPPTRFRVADGQVQHGTPMVEGKPFEPATDIENLNRARKVLREKIDLPPFSADAIPKEIGARISRTLDELEGKMLAASQDYSHGMNIFKKMSDKFVNPLKNQPIGQLAAINPEGNAANAQEVLNAQRNVLFRIAPEPGSENVIRSAITHLNAKDLTVARDLTRQYLARSFDEVGQDLAKGANEWGGAKVAAAIAGNTQQAKNLRAVVETMEGGGAEAWKGLNNFLEVLRATGKRQPGGSMTAYNAEINREMGNSGALLGSAKLALSPGRVITKADEVISRWQQNANGETLAGILLDNDALKKLRYLARISPESPNAKLIVSGIVGAPNKDSEK